MAPPQGWGNTRARSPGTQMRQAAPPPPPPDMGQREGRQGVRGEQQGFEALDNPAYAGVSAPDTWDHSYHAAHNPVPGHQYMGRGSSH